ncbi:MAG: DNA polymerase III subunit delta' [Desulfobulbaceae bacterium]|nr:DNA polymerase III subunit delta' [Desulfobulbaceae bacterium]
MTGCASPPEIRFGQPKAAELLGRSLTSGKLAHAYLFRGPAGVGKRAAAIAFAARINCGQPEGDTGCGRCPSCRKFFSGNHPDLMVVAPEGAAIKISQVREVKKGLAFPPFEARHRVVLLTDIHTMRREAANSLLKTLEEPPADTILILTGDEAGDILPTILSRCQVIPFFALPYHCLATTLQDENALSTEEAFTLAAAAEGSLDRARALIKNDLLSCRREIVHTLLQYPATGATAVEPILALTDRAAELKEELPDLLDLLRLWLRDLIVTTVGGAPDLITSRDLLPSFAAARQRWPLTELFDRLARIDQAEKQLLRNCNRALVCEVLFFALL